MPRILIDARAIADPDSGGVGRVARKWVSDWVNRSRFQVPGQEIELGTGNRGQHPVPTDFFCVTTGLRPSKEVKKFCEDLGMGYLHLKIPNKFWTLGCWLKIFALDRAAEKKVGPIDRLFLPNLGFVGKLTRPFELLLHDASFAIEPRWFNRRRRLWHAILPVAQLIRGADRLHCVSERTRDDAAYIYGAPKDNCTIFKFDPNLPNGETVRPVWFPDCAQRFVLLMGGADPRKNVKTALMAVTHYNFNHPELKIVPVVLGGQPNQTANHPIPCIQPTARVTEQELRYLYSNALAFLYPSWYEGYGLPLHEAKFFNTPCLSSTAGALPETAPKGTLFCHPAKPHEWLAALELIADRGLG